MKFSKVVFTRQIDLGAPNLNSYTFDTNRGCSMAASEHGVLIEHEALPTAELVPWHLVERAVLLPESTVAAPKLKAAK